MPRKPRWYCLLAEVALIIIHDAVVEHPVMGKRMAGCCPSTQSFLWSLDQFIKTGETDPKPLIFLVSDVKLW